MPAKRRIGAYGAWHDTHRQGLRVALAISVGFCWSVYTGAIIPFLGPFFAAQFLLGNSRPLSLPKALALIVIVLVAGIILQFIMGVSGHRPMILLLILGIIYFFCFYLQATARIVGPPVFFVLVVAVMVPLLSILNRDLSASILSILVQGVVSGTLLMWIMHALIPNKPGIEPAPVAAVPNPDAMRIAATSAVILLIAVVACLTLDGLSAAIVIPITVVSVLLQGDVVSSSRTALGLVMVNLFGGVVASMAFAVFQLRPGPIFLFLILLLVGLMLGGRAAQNDPKAKLFAGALTIFLVVFGVGVSPIPGSAAESFSTRIVFVLGAIAYTIFMAALLWSGKKNQAESLA
jgi:hypothetical protein